MFVNGQKNIHKVLTLNCGKMPKTAINLRQNNQSGGLCVWDNPQSRPLFGENVMYPQIFSKIWT
jgi:hypothetical protein